MGPAAEATSPAPCQFLLVGRKQPLCHHPGGLPGTHTEVQEQSVGDIYPLWGRGGSLLGSGLCCSVGKCPLPRPWKMFLKP